MLRPENTILSLQRQLQDLLAEELGVITIGGAALPGVWVEPPLLPLEATVEGLLAIISDIPEQATGMMQQWRVNLVQWQRDSVGTSKLSDAVEKMRWTFPANRRERFLPVTNDSPSQVTFLLGFNEAGYSNGYTP